MSQLSQNKNHESCCIFRGFFHPSHDVTDQTVCFASRQISSSGNHLPLAVSTAVCHTVGSVGVYKISPPHVCLHICILVLKCLSGVGNGGRSALNAGMQSVICVHLDIKERGRLHVVFDIYIYK